mmetsp:Transcript_32363/g.91102  ORF Transcript_32363/g.91102 Transcript_32363/m.91102 type:complete len:278 (-) Transcript_32363:180-1013(-)
MVAEKVVPEKVVRLQEALLYEFGKPEFQLKLQCVIDEACAPVHNARLQDELLRVGNKVKANFGFDTSPEGVRKFNEVMEQYSDHPVIARNVNEVNILLYPHLRQYSPKSGMMSYEEWNTANNHLMLRLSKDDIDRRNYASKCGSLSRRGRVWQVTGGKHSCGVLVRVDVDLGSPPLIERLCFGAVVRELDIVGDRLFYEKVEGRGPPSGWVSVRTNGATLLSVVREKDRRASKGGGAVDAKVPSAKKPSAPPPPCDGGAPRADGPLRADPRPAAPGR